MSLALRERGRARTAADARAEQMRVLSAVDVEDTQLPGADRPLPPPQPVAEGILPAELVSGWALSPVHDAADRDLL